MTPRAHEKLIDYISGRVPPEKLTDVHEAAMKCLRAVRYDDGRQVGDLKRLDNEVQLNTVALLALLEDVVGPDEFRQITDIVMPTTPAAVSFDGAFDAAMDRAGVTVMLGLHRARKAEREVAAVIGMDEAREHTGDAIGLYRTGCRALGANVTETDYRTLRDTFRLVRQIRRGAAPGGLAMAAPEASDFAARFGVKHAPRVA